MARAAAPDRQRLNNADDRVPQAAVAASSMSRREAPGRREHGFTLLEMVVVMVIIAAAVLLGAMATTGGTQRMQLHSSTKQVAANLRYTRARAIASGEPQRFTIDPRTRTWQAPGGRHGKLPDALQVGFTGARQVQPEAGVGAVVFFDDGASTGGRVRLSSGRATWDVDVAWLTGEVTLARAGQ